MPTARRVLKLKVIAIVATLLFLVACYYAARKVMASDIELGMDRETVIKMLGWPSEENNMLFSNSKADAWELILFRQSIYQRIVLVDYDKAGKVTFIAVIHDVFGHQFQHIKH